VTEDSGEPERYSLNDAPSVERSFATRTTDNSARFFLPHLKPGFRLLDCGCGPGSITIGLARAVEPGEVVGIDTSRGQIEAARRQAAVERTDNVRFEEASVYELPFEDESFDAVFANALLIHLSVPSKAVAEMRRVLKPGGVIGIRDADRGFDLRSPGTPLLTEMFDLWTRILVHNGASPFYARNQKQLLVEAGFDRVSATAFPLTYDTPDATRRNAAGTRNVFESLARTAIAQGWIDAARVELISNDISAWGENPAAFGLTLWFSAVGWRR